MMISLCGCGNTLFFESVSCVACGREVGWCPRCRAVRALEPQGDGGYRCADAGCGSLLIKCVNYAHEGVCNRCVEAGEVQEGAEVVCDCCRYNETIPDLSVPGNRERWGRMEAAKRRLFYVLDELNLPYGTAADAFEPPLSFDFKGDLVPEAGVWRTMGEEERVFTGHAGGKITINIREADDVERERLRVDMGEVHRTVVGHFRHEIGHYYWDVLVKDRHEEKFKRLFGDHDNPPYDEALERHYQQGPPENWREEFISAYATMHPWEDWAETFAYYLDVASVLVAAANLGVVPEAPTQGLQAMLRLYHRVGLVANEMNRTMGLTDLVPEVVTPSVEEKLALVHSFVRGG